MRKNSMLIALILGLCGLNGFAGDVEIIKECVKKLDYKTDFELNQALECIHSRMPRVAPILIKELETTTNSRIKEGVMDILGYHKIKEAIPQILKSVKNKNKKIRESAVSALASVQDEETLPIFYELCKDENEAVKQDAIRTLIRFHKKGKVPSRIIDEIRLEIKTYLTSPNPFKRQTGAYFATELEAREFLPIIESLASNDTYYFVVKKRDRHLNAVGEEGTYPVREAAYKALTKLKHIVNPAAEIKTSLQQSTTLQ